MVFGEIEQLIIKSIKSCFYRTGTSTDSPSGAKVTRDFPSGSFN